MAISGQYYSLQSVVKGDLVQLVFGQKDFVMKIYERGVPGLTIPDMTGTVQIAMFNDMLYVLRNPVAGTIIVEAFANEVLLWRQTIAALNIFHLSFTVDQGGVYVLFRGNGVIQIPNGPTMNVRDGWVLIRFGENGQTIAATNITGATDMIVTNNNGEGNAVIYGNSTKPLIMNQRTVIDKTTLYSFAIFVSPTLGPNEVFVIDDIVVEKVAAGFNSLAHIERENTETTLIFNGVTGAMWTADLGDAEVEELQIFSGFLAVIAKNNTTNKWFLSQYSLEGELTSTAILPVEGDILVTQMAFNQARFLVYAISSIEGGRLLTEYDALDNILVWSVSVPTDTNLVTGTVSKVAIHYTNTIRYFAKRLPALVGAVSEVLWPGGTGTTGCPPGFNTCTCPTGSTGCIPPNCCPIHVLPDGSFPTVVRVDFIVTSAFAPVIPGQEYFLGNNSKLTTVETPKRYIGTAIDDTKVIMLQTGNLAS